MIAKLCGKVPLQTKIKKSTSRSLSGLPFGRRLDQGLDQELTEKLDHAKRAIVVSAFGAGRGTKETASFLTD